MVCNFLYLGNDGVVVGEWIVDVISFQKIFGLCGLNVNIVLESAKHHLQYGNMEIWEYGNMEIWKYGFK